MGEMKESNKKRGRNAGAATVLDFLKSRGKVWLLVAGVVLGVILLLFGSGFGETESAGSDDPVAGESAQDLQTYRESLEKELESLCGAVNGVSRVDVMVTIEGGFHVIYATDADGDPVTVGSGSGREALYKTLRAPNVVGVGVVCQGGDDPAVQRALIDLISTVLGISTNRVCVAGK